MNPSLLLHLYHLHQGHCSSLWPLCSVHSQPKYPRVPSLVKIWEKRVTASVSITSQYGSISSQDTLVHTFQHVQYWASNFKDIQRKQLRVVKLRFFPWLSSNMNMFGEPMDERDLFLTNSILPSTVYWDKQRRMSLHRRGRPEVSSGQRISCISHVGRLVKGFKGSEQW